ncbi:MAG: AtpZ/AtpI family protein [Lachnospiraceae bacterium]|nr:AtpZ/AtpI family protein [Lachnospiraceae bacterium]
MAKVFRKIAFITQFGLTMLIPTCLLFFLGYYLDKKLGTSFLAITLFFIGALAGGTGVWRLVKKELQNDSKDVRNRDLAGKEKGKDDTDAD